MADLIVKDQRTLAGAQVITRLVGERYVTEVWFKDALIGRAENTDRFEAGMAHGAYLLTWGAASASNLEQAAIEAREEGYGRAAIEARGEGKHP